MKLYSKRQNKKTLGIENLKGVSVVNVPTDGKYAVKLRAEVRRNGVLINGGIAENKTQAAELANKLFKQIYGGIRAAKKNGYWNSLPTTN